MYNKILLLVPTKGRDEKQLPAMLKSCIAMAEEPGRVSFAFLVEKNSKTEEVCRDLLPRSDFKIFYNKSEKPDYSLFYNLLFFYNRAKSLYCDCVYGALEDDFVFESKVWDTQLLETVNLFDGTGIFYPCETSMWRGRLAFPFFTTLKWVESQLNHFAEPGFGAMWMQMLAHDTAKKVSRLFFINSIKVRHDHQTNYDDPDATYVDLMRYNWLDDDNRKRYGEFVWNRSTAVLQVLADEFLKLPVIMTVCDRTDLLKKTVDSYNCSAELPDKITIFDDRSSDKQVAEVFKEMKGADVIINKSRHGCVGNTPQALRFMFEERHCEAVLVLDSDCELNTYWYTRANTIYRLLKNEPDFGLFCLFNANVHKCFEKHPTIPGAVRKEIVGGLGMVITKKIWKQYFPILKDHKDYGWDGDLCLKLKEAGKKIWCASPSFLQHTGLKDGTHMGGMWGSAAVANDFYGCKTEEVTTKEVKTVNNEKKSAVYRKVGLPLDFGPGHPDWNMPSKQNRYIAAMKELDQNV